MNLTAEMEGSDELRLLEVISYKILCVQKTDTSLDCLIPPGTKAYRIEQIPQDEINLVQDEFVIPVAHFQKVKQHYLILHRRLPPFAFVLTFTNLLTESYIEVFFILYIVL